MLKKLDFNLSASTINYFCTCPWAFKQDKILKRSTFQVPSVPLVLGQAFHKLLESFYRQKTFRVYDLFQNWERFFDIEVKVQKAEKLELKYARGSGFTLLKNWVTMAKANDWLHESIGSEIEFKQPYNNSRFEIDVHGYIDLLIEVNGKIYILDWKTGKHSAEKYRLQAILYSWALAKQFDMIEDCVRFVHPSKKENRIVDVKVTDEDYYAVMKKVDKMFDAIEADCFEKVVSDNCKWCSWTDCPHNINENGKLLAKKMLEEDNT